MSVPTRSDCSGTGGGKSLCAHNRGPHIGTTWQANLPPLRLFVFFGEQVYAKGTEMIMKVFAFLILLFFMATGDIINPLMHQRLWKSLGILASLCWVCPRFLPFFEFLSKKNDFNKNLTGFHKRSTYFGRILCGFFTHLLLAVGNIKQVYSESMRWIVSTYQDLASIQGEGGLRLLLLL